MLVTLVFVVVQLKHLSEQTRQNTLAIKFSSYGSHADTLSQFQQNLGMDTGLGDVVFECQRAQVYGDDSIDEKVWWRYSLAMQKARISRSLATISMVGTDEPVSRRLIEARTARAD